jgi:hypothetical protein
VSNEEEIVGKRGEVLFRAFITKWCRGKPWFDERFLGEKAEGLDFEVTLRDSAVFHASCFIQVKSTARPKKRYKGRGKRRQLRVALTRADAEKLGNMKVPAYVVGVDVRKELAFVRHIPFGSKKGFTGISTSVPLNCDTIKKMWQEVAAFWTGQQGMKSSQL